MPAPAATAVPQKQRVDKWLWHARFFKTRSRASDICRAGRVRVNGTVIAKGVVPVAPGDVLTFPQGTRIRVVRVTALGVRRGPPGEARGLFDDLDAAPGPTVEGTGFRTC